MISRGRFISTEINKHLGYGLVKFSPILMMLNARVSIEIAKARTEPTSLHRLMSRRHFPWIAFSFRLPRDAELSELTVAIQFLGRTLRVIPKFKLMSTTGGTVSLPESLGASGIHWIATEKKSSTQVEICRSAQGNDSICVDKSALQLLVANFELQESTNSKFISDQLPEGRSVLLENPSEVWILGNAPSVNLSDLNRIAETGFFTIALNRFHKSYPLHDLREDILISADDLVIDQFGVEILKNSLGLPIFLSTEPKQQSAAAPKHAFALNGKIREEPLLSINQEVSAYGSSLIAAIQIALFLGFKKIYLYGVDLDFDSFTNPFEAYSNEPNNHFIANYRSGLPWNQPQWDRIMPGMVAVALAAKVRSAEIVNYTPGNRFKLFPAGTI